MRLTFINQFYTPDISPTAHLCASIAEHRAALGDQVTVLTSRAGYLGAVGSGAGATGVRVRRLWSTRFGSRTKFGRLLDWVSFYLPAFITAIFLPRQDVIISMTTPPFIALAGVLHKMLHPSCRLIFWSMDVYPEALERTKLIKAGGFISAIMRFVQRRIFARVDHLICLDGAMADILLSQYTLRHGREACTIIPNWEPLNLAPRKMGDTPTLQNPGTTESTDRFVILYLGNAGFGHEFATMIAAADRLRDVPVIFRFVGGGIMRPWIAEQAARRNLTNIELLDYVPKDQTPGIMASASAALITLENDMLGVMSPSKLHSNLAMGLPIIYVGPQGSNVDEAITRFDCGMSLRPGDADGLTELIRRLQRDEPYHGQLRRNARLAFESAYCDARTLTMLDEVIGMKYLPA